MLEIILLVLVSALLGTALGIFTGLTPGIHVNTVAMILLSLSPLAAELLEGLLGMEGWLTLLMVGSLIVATSMAHTFLDFIPSTFLGAPEPETALSVLPAHGMLMEGRGYRAVYLSAVGSFGAVVVGFMLLLPYRFVVNEPVNGYRFLKEYMVWALIAVVLLTLCTETARLPYRPVKHPGRGFHLEKGPFSRFFGIAAALSLFLLTGLLGLAILKIEAPSPFGLPTSILFPTLSGLFGTSSLIESIRGGAKVPHQEMETPGVDLRDAASSSLIGGTAGSVVGFLPGMSGGVATVVAMLFRKDPKPSSVILTLSAINTANSFFVLAALFLILRPRSGAAIVVNELIQATRWDGLLPPVELTLFLISSLFACCLGFFLTIWLGKALANWMPKAPYGKLAVGIIIFITVMVFLFTGWMGFIVLAVSTAVGSLAPYLGVRRSHAMGVLLLPVIIMFW